MSEPDSLGPPTERTAPAQRAGEQFEQTVGALADGQLQFAPPFDLAASAALAGNATRGAEAIRAYAAARARSPVNYRLRVDAVIEDARHEREILDVTMPSLEELFMILAQLIDEETE